jgi:hypothetical protein
VSAGACTVSTSEPEGDGTLTWDATTMVYARVAAGGDEGLGYSYTDASAAGLIDRVAPAPVVRVPFLRSDVHDLDGLRELQQYLA